MLCDHLEGWDKEGGRETQERGDMGIYVYIKLIQFVIQQKHNIVNQLCSNKDVKKKKTTAMRRPCTTTKSNPRSLQLEEARVQQRRPNAAKNQ